MKIQRFDGRVLIEFKPSEARVFLDELSHLRGGARMPKIRQICAELELAFGLGEPVSKCKKCGANSPDHECPVAKERTVTPKLPAEGSSPPQQP